MKLKELIWSKLKTSGGQTARLGHFRFYLWAPDPVQTQWELVSDMTLGRHSNIDRRYHFSETEAKVAAAEQIVALVIPYLETNQ